MTIDARRLKKLNLADIKLIMSMAPDLHPPVSELEAFAAVGAFAWSDCGFHFAYTRSRYSGA